MLTDMAAIRAQFAKVFLDFIVSPQCVKRPRFIHKGMESQANADSIALIYRFAAILQ